MSKVILFVAELATEDSVYALDPTFAEGAANATREWIHALVFQSKDEALEWCAASPLPFNATELTFEVTIH